MTVPRELLRSAPRQVQLSAAGKMTMVGVLMLALGGITGAAFLHVKAGRDQERADRRAATGITTTGVIVNAELKKGKKRRWNLTYSFDANGKSVMGKLATRKAFDIGDSVVAGYLPGQPEDNWIIGQEPRGGLFFLAPLPGVVSFCLSGLMFWLLKRQLYLATYGRPAIATATGSRKVHHQHGYTYRVSYDFPLLNGSIRKGSLDLQSNLEPGTQFAVIYNPDQPKHVGRYPFSLVMVPKG